MVGNNQNALSSIKSVKRGNALDEAVAVLDVGKTHAKLSLIGADGALLATRSRSNAALIADGRPALDPQGIEALAVASLKDLPTSATLFAVAPLAHGAT